MIRGKQTKQKTKVLISYRRSFSGGLLWRQDAKRLTPSEQWLGLE
jgi:hypothetical protein